MRLLHIVALLLRSTVAIAHADHTLNTYPAGGSTELQIADFNSDGKPDLLGCTPNSLRLFT